MCILGSEIKMDLSCNKDTNNYALRQIILVVETLIFPYFLLSILLP